MKTVSIFQALRHALSVDRTQASRCVASGPVALSHDMLGFVTGGKGNPPATTTSPLLPKGKW